MEAVKRVLTWNGAIRPRLNLCVKSRTDQFDHKSIGINQSNYFFSETRSCFLSRHVLLVQTFQPITHRTRWNRERCRFDLAGSANSASRSRPRKKCQDCSGRAVSIAEIKMVGARIIKIHRTLHEAQTEKPDVKVEVPLRIRGDRSDVMQSRDFPVLQDGDNPRLMLRRFFRVRPSLRT